MTSAQVSAPGAMSVRPSKILALWVALGLALVITFSTLYLPLWAAVCLGLTALIFAVPALRVHALKSHPDAVVALRHFGNGIDYQLRSGRWISGTVVPGALVSRWLTVIRIRPVSAGAEHASLILLPDNIEPEDYRRLRVFLRWTPENEVAGDQ